MNSENLISKVVQEIPPSGIRKYFDFLDDSCISLGVGEPDFATPDGIREEALRRLSRGRIPYTSNAGMPELRELILKYLEARFDIKGYSAGEVLVTVGGSQAIDLAMRAILDPGDEVILPEPTYVSYTPSIRMAGGVPVTIPVTQEQGFKLMPDALRAAITPRTKAVLIPYPNNPTGGIMERKDLEAIGEVLKDTDILVITDEIYAELTFNGKRHVSFASIPGMRERTILLSGFSKAFSMTGWRLGYAVGPQPLVGAMTKVHQLTMLCAPNTAQVAGVVAIERGLKNDWADTRYMIDEYDKRRRYIADAFNGLGLTCNEPEGAFYVFPSVRSTGLSCEEFSDRLMAEQKVVVIPGSAFGSAGEGHVRCCYATDLEKIKVAMDRIGAFLKTL
jgi:aminotransferase